MKINHSFQINSLLKMIPPPPPPLTPPPPPPPPPLLGELFCGGKN